MGKKESILREKSLAFAVKIVQLSRFLQVEKKEFVLNKQILKSGTTIGALVREAEYAQSNADFINKFSIALKEANETEYWLLLLKDTEHISLDIYNSLSPDCDELISILVATIKTLKAKNT